MNQEKPVEEKSMEEKTQEQIDKLLGPTLPQYLPSQSTPMVTLTKIMMSQAMQQASFGPKPIGGIKESQSARAGEPKKFEGVHRNAKCPCGSGRKFKKCCIV